jgi:trehalose synthase-fused probable maltokinase
MASRFDVAVEATGRALRESRRMRTWLQSLRWCGNAIRLTADLVVKDRAVLAESGSEAIVLFLPSVKDSNRGARTVHLPLSIASVRLDPAAFELEASGDTFYVMEGERRESYVRFVIDAFRRGAKIRTESGDFLSFRGDGIAAFRGISPVQGGDTSNVLLRIGTATGEVVLKSYKLLDPGNREADILSRLRARKFPHTARLLGEMFLGRGKDRFALGMATEHVDSVDLFTWLRDAWHDALSDGRETGEEFVKACRSIASDLGEATAALHDALIDRHPGPWQTEIFTPEDFRVAFKTATRSLGASLRRLGQLATDPEPLLAHPVRSARALLLGLRAPIEETLGYLEASVGGVKSVIHSDLHLAQVLRGRSDGKLWFIDFEGEPERAPGDRGRKLPPLRDVATMVRSFAYVRHYVMRDFVGVAFSLAAPAFEPDAFPAPQGVLDRLIAWERDMVDRFTEAYLSGSALYRVLHRTEIDRLVRGWALEKALYELEYELKHRIENFPIPVDGIAALVSSGRGPT